MEAGACKGEGCSPHYRQEVIREVLKALCTSKASFQGLLSLAKSCLQKFLPFLQVVPPAGDQVLNTPALWGTLMFKQKLAPQTGLFVFVSCTLIQCGGRGRLGLFSLGKRSATGQLQVFFSNTGTPIVCDLLSIHMTDLKQGEEENMGVPQARPALPFAV